MGLHAIDRPSQSRKGTGTEAGATEGESTRSGLTPMKEP